MSETIYARLGGEKAIDVAVDMFYKKVLADSRINQFFQDVDMQRQASMQKAFLTVAFGGPQTYTGDTLRNAHTKLVAKGLNDGHFDAVMEHLGATLQELEVPDALIGEAAAIAESVRNDILCR